MIPIKLIRENPNLIENSLKKRNNPEMYDKFKIAVQLDIDYRKKLQDVEQLNKKRNELVKEIAIFKKAGKNISKLLEESKNLPKIIEDTQKDVDLTKEKLDQILMVLPNILHESVPIGLDENDNVLVDEYKPKGKKSIAPKSHIDIIEKYDLVDLERAAKISGARFYFLKNELALLDLALQKYAVDFMINKGFNLILPPLMINKKSVEGVTDLSAFNDTIYKIEGEDLYMIATSEHPLIAMYQDEVIEEENLPIKLIGLSQCFRKEAGSHGKDTKGIFRVHQFTKVEQIIISKPEDSWQFHEEMIEIAKDFFKSLDIPFRQVNICTGDIGTVASKKYDLEAWMPAQKKYREIVSCSNCTDYQSNRLKIRYRTVEDKKQVNKLVHTLNSTVVATSRALVAIIENYQDSEGNIKIPDVLIPYMNGVKIIKTKK